MSAVIKDINFATDTTSVKIDSYPASEKIYVQGSRPDIQVPMRKITLSDTPAHFGAEKNPPLYVYDTSGVYTDPNVSVDLKKGLGSIRSDWIAERNDT
ncbi:MAG: phosphomethylpyrimidine synthase ThiC, partial [Methylobacter sp.]